MSIAKMLDAKRVYREGMEELFQIVKNYLESVKIVELSTEEELKDGGFKIDFSCKNKDNEKLNISVWFAYIHPNNLRYVPEVGSHYKICHYYIECKEYEVYTEPPQSKEMTAQGTIEVVQGDTKIYVAFEEYPNQYSETGMP